MNRIDRYLQSLARSWPELTVTSVELNAEGQNNHVLVINAEWIVRFPRFRRSLERLADEAALLAAIEPHVTLPVPVFAHVDLAGCAATDPEGAGPLAYAAYRRLTGEPLWQETFRAIDNKATINSLAAQLAGFLSELHSVPARAIVGLRLRREDTAEDLRDFYRRVRQRLFRHMRPDAQDGVADHFEQFLSDSANFDHQPVLRHGDFGASNILWGPPTGRVTGVLDFGSTCLGDPAYDFAGLLSCYGEAFVGRCARTYPQVLEFMPRARFYGGTFALGEALFGAEQGDAAAFEAGLAPYV